MKVFFALGTVFLLLNVVSKSLACEGMSGKTCLDKAGRSSMQNAVMRGMRKDTDDTKLLFPMGTTAYCYTVKKEDKSGYEQANCDSSCDCDDLGVEVEPLDPNRACESGGKRCLRHDEVDYRQWGMMEGTGNGSPCFSAGTGNFCFVERGANLADSNSFKSCDCAVPNCKCNTPAPSPCTTDIKPDHNCTKMYPSTSTMTKCGTFGTACAPACMSGQLTEAEKKTLVDAHNDYRRKVAKGLETKSAVNGNSQPRATNMNKLVWDNELANIAQVFADTCTGSHDTNKERETLDGKSAGQNAFVASYMTRDMQAPVDSWYSETQFFPPANAGNFTKAGVPLSDTKKDGDGNFIQESIGHYTQVVWAETKRVGCGFTVFTPSGSNQRQTRIICNYAPPGNYKEAVVYKVADTDDDIATECPGQKDDGLCL